MMLFAVGLLVGILLSCVVAWFAACEMIDQHNQAIDDFEFRMNELQRDRDVLRVDCKETARQLEIATGRLEDWKKEAEYCCERREILIRELKILLEKNQ